MGVVLYVLLCGRYPFTGDQNEMEKNQTKATFEFPKKVGLSNEAKFVITSLVRRDPKQRMSLINCLRCKWATRSMMHVKCAFYKPRIPMERWECRRYDIRRSFQHTTFHYSLAAGKTRRELV